MAQLGVLDGASIVVDSLNAAIKYAELLPTLVDWACIDTYAFRFEERQEARHRIRDAGGTLDYIEGLRKRINAVLTKEKHDESSR